jgi:acyl-CoA reductase-like NAD-dependent aldehyde dehydrogenase
VTASEAPGKPVTEIRRSNMLIDGEWRPSATGETIDVENPADRSKIGEVPRATGVDVDGAVAAAGAAFESWRLVAPRGRGQMLVAIADDLSSRTDELARLIATETGNALRTQARPEAASAVDIFRYFGGAAAEIKGTTVPLGEGLLNYNRREPIGVVAGIIPWNAPVQLGALKIAMALCTGNTLVLKAAEDAPLAVLKMAEICQAHLPRGVLNVITGYGEECGAALAQHPGVAKISFTGSTEVGKEIIRAAAGRIARVSLELGGKSPALVFPDSDSDGVVDGVIMGMRFTRQGQSCTAGSRLFLHAGIFDSFMEKLVAKLGRLRIGDPLDEATDMGAIINKKQYDRVCSYIQDGMQSGAQTLIGGPPDGDPDLANGYFVRPTVLSRVENDWRIAREEIFGPVLVAIPWTDEENVIRMANHSHYGLAAYVWCRDISRALKTAHRLESGWVQVNRGGGQLPGMSYGGFKQSGWGSEYSIEGALEAFTQVKNVTVNLDF